MNKEKKKYKYPEYQKEWYENNKERLTIVRANYYLDNKQEMCKKQNIYYLNNKEKVKQRSSEYSKSLPKEKHVYNNAKRRAKKRNIEFNLELEDIKIPEYCPVLGIKLNLEHTKQQDDSPSIDRIDNNKGYTKDNIQIISYKANRIKSNATIEEIEKLLNYLKSICRR